MQKFEFLRQPLLEELAMSRKKEERGVERREREKNAIYSGHLRLCQQPRPLQIRSSKLLCLSPIDTQILMIQFEEAEISQVFVLCDT
jgi:hypothetical protein